LLVLLIVAASEIERSHLFVVFHQHSISWTNCLRISSVNVLPLLVCFDIRLPSIKRDSTAPKS
ncbi:MAG TPA: hypothetical protein VLU47_03920, partial [Blastocatellia bacterium]|nr:hypothetical protein [Blastocatellia bacterium]